MSTGTERTIGLFCGDSRQKESRIGSPSQSLLGRLMQRLRGNIGRSAPTPVGSHIAAQSSIEALMQHGAADHYDLFVLPPLGAPTAAQVAQWVTGRQKQTTISVHKYQELFSKADNSWFTVWFDAFGYSVVSVEIRANIIRKIYPITAIHHTFNHHLMLHAWILRLLLADTRPCDSIVCGSRSARQSLSNIFERVARELSEQYGAHAQYRGRFDLIPNCVDTELFRPDDPAAVRHLFGLPLDAIVILYFGRFALANKADLLPLVRVFERLVQDNPTRKLLLVLAGVDRRGYAQALQEYVAALDLLPNVRILRDVGHPNRHSLYKAADIFVSPADSIQEVFPLTPIEAMACGVPQVVADWDGYRDSVRHGETGFLVPTYWTGCDTDLCDTGGLLGWQSDYVSLAQSVAVDLNSLRYHLQLLIQNDGLRAELGRRARQRAVSFYSYPAVVKMYESLWDELLDTAQHIIPQPMETRYRRPAYHDLFAHYASTLLNEQTHLRLTISGREAVHIESLVPAYQELSEYGILSEELLSRALAELACFDGYQQQPEVEAASGLAGMTFGDLIRCLVGPLQHRDCICRHIMWLIKYGYIEPSF
jgi:D-inositol-3-phosphate glycosyltransferase